jgi:hypothetical protein
MESGWRSWSQVVNWTLFGSGVWVIQEVDKVLMTTTIVELV